ncbi:MAG: methyltransferase domain-containing protein [Deltaproteobacteria bacterium]|nr:methyltransferase domain-containing protein [Deltaproteobacteria bacterium]
MNRQRDLGGAAPQAAPLPRSRLLWLPLLLALLGCAGRSHHPHGATHGHGAHDATVRHSFEDVEHWKAVFDDPARDAWQQPRAVVDALGIMPGMCVADIGAGTGYFSRYLSTAVGENGSVLAAEPEPNLLGHLRQRAETEGSANLTPILASFDNPRLPAGAVDLVLIVDTFHHIDDRLNYFRRLQRALKPGGRVAIVDFKKEEAPVGPPVEHKLAREQVVEELQRAGYQLLGEPVLLPYQYVLIFAPR